MLRLIVTGANGAGKSHLARQLVQLRPDMPLISYDAMRLTTGWQKRPASEVTAALTPALQQPRWIIEGGPSLLPLALPLADAVVWLDPPVALRAWRLIWRPLRHVGRTRPELPPGNRDWPLRQYRFALASLRAQPAFFRTIHTELLSHPGPEILILRGKSDITAFRAHWKTAMESTVSHPAKAP